jgi:hypothetical protein
MNWTDTTERLEEFFVFLNSLYKPIRWTKEVEQQGIFNIFDIRLIRCGNSFETTVYRKPSASDRYIHFTSEQAWHEKVAAIHTLTRRAYYYCSTKDLLGEEICLLRKVFLNNGYPEEAINHIMKSIGDKHGDSLLNIPAPETTTEEPERDFKQTFMAPYHPQARRLFSNLTKTCGITCVYKRTPTLGTHLLKRRPPQPFWESKNVVYSIPCEDSSHQYIGQTKRKLIQRKNEHERSCKDVSNIDPDSNYDNGVPFHVAQTGHQFQFDKMKILETEPNGFRRRMLESIHILKNRDSVVNLKAGIKIDPCWRPLIEDLDTDISDNGPSYSLMGVDSRFSSLGISPVDPNGAGEPSSMS